jgi:hypothetical protein
MALLDAFYLALFVGTFVLYGILLHTMGRILAAICRKLCGPRHLAAGEDGSG